MKNVKRGVQYSVTRNDKIMRRGKPSNGLTSARLYNTENDVLDLINHSKAPFVVSDATRYRLSDSYHAVTSCLMTDTYDEEKGKDIAKRKMLLKYNGDKLAKIELALSDLDVIYNRLLRQKQIISERMARDIDFLQDEIAGQ